jgi:SAM-dependent methyltransferase
MLARAREVAAERGVSNVRFEAADAQTHPFPPSSFDALFSRFGVMFFAGPEAAFANLRRALRSGGRVAFVCWRAVTENPWMMVPMMAAAQHILFPPPPPPGAPGAFAFADADRVHGILSGAGFSDVAIEPIDETMSLGGTIPLDETVEFLLQMGPTGSAMREVGEEMRGRVASAVREAVAPYETPQGVRMDAALWLVTARNAG